MIARPPDSEFPEVVHRDAMEVRRIYEEEMGSLDDFYGLRDEIHEAYANLPENTPKRVEGTCSYCGQRITGWLREPPKPVLPQCEKCGRREVTVNGAKLYTEQIQDMTVEQAEDYIDGLWFQNELEAVFRKEARTRERRPVLKALYERFLILRVDMGAGFNTDQILTLPEWHREVRREVGLPVSESERGWADEMKDASKQSFANRVTRREEAA